jgi:hypothetical protein
MNKTFLTILFVLFGISVTGGMLSIYLDIKKWWSWLFVLTGFISGFIIGLLKVNISGGLILGAVFSFITISGGVLTRFYRLHYEKKDRNR